MNNESVLVVGSANMDLVAFTKMFPKPGETVFGSSFHMFPGGKGANQAVACSKLGMKTFFISKLGKDNFGNSLLSSLGNDNIDLSYVISEHGSTTGTALITVDSNGENEIIVISGANMELSPEEIKKCKNIFSDVKIVLTQLEIPIETVKTVVEYSKKSDSLMILNPAPASNLDDEILENVDILTPNETELELLSNQKIISDGDIEAGARSLLGKGVKNVIVTLGEKGAKLVNKEGVTHFPSIKVNAIDSTAAGDTFNGALANFLAKDLPMDHAIEQSIKAAAISVTKKGAQASMPSMEEMNIFDKK